MSNSLFVLVTGATGQQGGAVARLLLRKGHKVRALTRKADSPEASELRGLGAEVVSGSMEDRAAMDRAAAGVDAVFSVTTPFGVGMEAETRQGTTVADAAKAAEVKHLVFNSVAGADTGTGIPHFESKHRVEQHLQSLLVPYTIVAPVFFMDNLLGPLFRKGLQEGKLAMALPASRPLQQVPVENIAEVVVLVLEGREPFLGQRIDLASDEVSGREAAEILSRVCERKIQYVEVPLEQVRRQSDDLGRMFEWFDRVGYHADIPGLRRAFPEVNWRTLEQWLERQDLGPLRQAGPR